MTGRRHQTDRPLWDPGAQPERTFHAWIRTALAMAACALLATRLTRSHGTYAVLLCLFGVLWALTVAYLQRRRLMAGPIAPAPWSVLAMATTTVALALGTLALVVSGASSGEAG